MTALHRCPGLAAIAALVALLPACASRSQTLTVSAAASLTDAFIEIADAFEAAHPGVTVELNLAASGVLAQQIRQGAMVDVFASASGEVMDRLAQDGLLAEGTRRNIAANSIVLVVPLDGAAVPGLADLAGAQRVAIGNPALVPAGMYAQESLQGLGLWEALEGKLVYGESVRQVLAWVETGEVQAGVVFATDARTSPHVRVVTEMPPQSHAPIRYPIAVPLTSHAPQLARQFAAFVAGPQGREILARHGFALPGEAVL